VRRGEQVHAIVAPSPRAAEFGDRHEFNNGDSDGCEFSELRPRPFPRAFGRECPDVHFINDLAFRTNSFPRDIGPMECGGIDNLGRPVGAIRLKTRLRIRIEKFGAVQPELILRTGSRGIDDPREVSICLRRQRKALVSEDYLHLSAFGCPDAEIDAFARKNRGQGRTSIMGDLAFTKLPLGPQPVFFGGTAATAFLAFQPVPISQMSDAFLYGF
jgi:hypothetical protein